MVTLNELSDEQIKIFIGRYVEEGLTSGGVFDLPTLRRELARRNGAGYDGRNVVKCILELSHESDDDLATYGELHNRLFPGEGFKGHKSLGRITKALDAAVVYCYTHSLPVVTVLIINAANRQLTPEAKKNIFNRCRELGFDTGVDAERFVDAQVEASKQVALNSLPET